MIVKRMGAVAATAGAAFEVALIAVVFARTPAALTAAGGWVVQSAVLALAALAACVAAMWHGPLSTMDSRVGTVAGLVLGALLGAENVGEVLSPAGIPPEYAIVALMALAYLVSGALGGIRAAMRTVVVAYLVWYPTVWLTYLLGDGTPGFERALRAEGEYDDFARSGLSDFHVFLVRDLLGAGFFHLVLAVVLGLGAGAGGAGLALLYRRAARSTHLLRRAAVVVVGTLALAAGTGSAASAGPAYRAAPVHVDRASIALSATRSAPPVVTRCAGSPGTIEVRTELTGQASSPDPRLSGTLSVRARVLLAVTGGGVGFTTGTVVISDPATGRVKVRARLTQLETDQATTFNGLLDGTVEPGDGHLVALYSGHIDPAAGVLAANVGTDSPDAPHHTGVVVTGACGPDS